nr:hypothetical protein Ahy_B01g054800 isoform A [Ipomoea batatas]
MFSKLELPPTTCRGRNLSSLLVLHQTEEKIGEYVLIFWDFPISWKIIDIYDIVPVLCSIFSNHIQVEKSKYQSSTQLPCKSLEQGPWGKFCNTWIEICFICRSSCTRNPRKTKNTVIF